MNFKKGAVGVLTLLSAVLVSCQKAGGLDISPLYIWNKLLWIGSLGFLGHVDNEVAAFMRVMVFLLTFTVLYALFNTLSNATGVFTRNIAITLSILFSIISAIFIPGSVLIGIGAAYGTLVAFFFVGVPVLGGLYLLNALPNATRWDYFVRIVVILVLLAILIAVKTHADGFMNDPNMMFVP